MQICNQVTAGGHDRLYSGRRLFIAFLTTTSPFPFPLLPLELWPFSVTSSLAQVAAVTPFYHDGGYLGGFGALGSQFSLSLPQRRTATRISAAGWFSGFGAKKGKGAALLEIDKAGNPVFHQLTNEVPPQEIGSEKIQKIIKDTVAAMRKAPGVGLTAPQIGVLLKVTFFLIG
ncbi:hypothetical protein Cni_G09754 [Canna indica]|uniref:Peptide deformylase n=1 Tax=Canna indica TaxID=4628 RepID=A0AAQ3Q6S0_9LILI|nr:hypothetical protein Cni_G09754 [Canna indica]